MAVLGPGPLNLDAAITALPALAARLDGARPASTLRGAGPFGQSSTARVAGRVLLVGDAAGYVDALTGEGLRVGFARRGGGRRDLLRPAGRLRGAVAADHPLLSQRHPHLLWVGARRPLRPMIVPAARAMPRTFTRVVDQIAG